MAEGNGEEENPYSFRTFSRKKESRKSDEADDPEEKSVRPDLGIGNQRNYEKKPPPEVHSSGSEMPKREENPFSFKHFLKRDSGNNYHSTGARPKVYTNLSPENFDNLGADTSDSESSLYTRNTTPRHVATPEITSVLPDFVQDHLVVEQCYLAHSDTSNSPQLAVDLENLPDFAINNLSATHESPSSRQWNEPKKPCTDNKPKDIPFDLTGTTSDQLFSRRVRKNSGPVPLDLPSPDRGLSDVSPGLGTSTGGLPFDLPLVSDISDVASTTATSGVRSGPSLGEVGVSKSLPDFLSDGPIHSGLLGDVEPVDDCETRNDSVEDHAKRLQSENERLRRELDLSRRHCLDQKRRIQMLEKELLTMQSKESEETASLEKAIEQVEDNLKRSTRRAVSAESQVSKLKQETKILMSEIAQLRRENRELRSGQGASSVPIFSQEQQTQRLSHELRAAADSAEMSLRQLLSGVGNLRVIASTLENLHRIHDRTTDFLSDIDDDEAGPAL
ncbi:uncharacterized protein l(3)04053 [Anabrus simplex]|uniref:uncharacterized protein l(3)04053 n=1 Tax=Anabrus simplex TaxID=316456 RepID=UPI0035A347F7